MEIITTCRWLLLVVLLFPVCSNADDLQVASWTEQVLINSLSLDYKTIDSTREKYKTNYTVNAREALRLFLGGYIARIKAQQLTLHPKILSPAKVVDRGDFSGIQFWRVNQIIALPELDLHIDFSVVVIKASKPPYLIQSLNMIKHAL